MVAPPSMVVSSSATPTQKTLYNQQSQPFGSTVSKTNLDRDGLQPPGALSGARTPSNVAFSYGPRGSSLAASPAPGSFSVDMRSQLAPSRAISRSDMVTANMETLDEDEGQAHEQILLALRESLNREMKIKEGSENMLEALNTKKAKQTKEQRARVEAELTSSNLRIKQLKTQILELQQPKQPATPTRNRMVGLFQSSGVRSPAALKSAPESDQEEPVESPTYALAEILQALEIEGLTPAYYVGHANNLVDLFKRHPTLKYDLVWSIFGLRMQVMLLSESREVVAAGYRMTRHAISDLASLQKIRSLHTDCLVIYSLIKERKADVEREQALKLVRAFLDVKDGVREISRGVVRTIAAVAEHEEDRLRSICVETLAEIMIRNPELLVTAGGLRPLVDSLGEGNYDASEGLTSSFLYLLDAPQRRKYLRSGYELEILFTPFTNSSFTREKILKQNARAISSAMKSWPGLMTLSMNNFRAIKSLVSSLILPYPAARETVIGLLFGLLRIKAPSWSTSFLAGRRLTTYGRVANLKTVPTAKGATTAAAEEDTGEKNLVDHYTALVLAVLISAGLLPALLQLTREAESQMLIRKTTLLIGEVLKLAYKLLPSYWSSDLQFLPDLFTAAAKFDAEERFQATSTIYQIDRINRTLYKFAPATPSQTTSTPNTSTDNLTRFDETLKSAPNFSFDEGTFRQMILDTGVMTSANYLKWKWDNILKIIEGPFLSGKRLDEAIKAAPKFLKRMISFYRPFKYKFSEIRNTRPNQKYVKVACALIHTFLQTAEGVKYLADSKLLRQMAECLAQCDPTSGLTAQSPMFSPSRLTETLCNGYFAMIGVLSGDQRGLAMLDRWRMINMMYHIFSLTQRPDLIKLLLANFDYGLQGHPRVLLSKALTAGSKDVRIHGTNILRRYSSRSRISTAAGQGVGDSKWAIQMLVTQLYDPEVDVCATAIRILEEACNRKNYLEYIVECRPALDHLGEIGAPLLLRFLSTSIGYHYLDGLDYISNEMDDWFLGRNDTYVGVIEAVLARAFIDSRDEPSNRISIDEDIWDADRQENDARVPPHFYRELTRTKEGCKLLRDKGHFEEFASTIREQGMQTEDSDIILKVKGCLWAVGNVGSMALGAPFLEESDVVQQIVKIAETHEIMSLRGTAFFVLGLISRTVHGLEILSEHGWDSVTGSMGESLGLCIPTDLSKIFSYVPWKHEKPASIPLDDVQTAAIAIAKTDDDEDNQRILQLVTEVGSTVLAKKALSELSLLKSKNARGFKQAQLFRKVMTILECHNFHLTFRRAVYNLFNKSIIRQIVLDEQSSEDEVDSAEDSESGATARQRSISAASTTAL